MGTSQNKKKSSQSLTAATRAARTTAQGSGRTCASASAVAAQHTEEQHEVSTSGAGVAHPDHSNTSAAHPRGSKRTVNEAENEPAPEAPNDLEDVPLSAPPKKRARKQNENRKSPSKPGKAPVIDASQTPGAGEDCSAQKRSQQRRQVPGHAIPRSAYESSSSSDEHDNNGNAPQRLSLRIPPRRAKDTATRPVEQVQTRSTSMMLGSDSDSSWDPGRHGMPASSNGSNDSDSHGKDPGDDLEDLLLQDPHQLSEIINAEIPCFPSDAAGHLPSPHHNHDLLDKSVAEQDPARLRHELQRDVYHDDARPAAATGKGNSSGGRRQQAFEIEKPYFRTTGPATAVTHTLIRSPSAQQLSKSTYTTGTPDSELLHSANDSRARPMTAAKPLTRSSAAAQRHHRAASSRLSEGENGAESSCDDAEPHSGDGRRAWSAVPDPVISAASGEILLKKQGKAVQEIIDIVNEQVKYHVSFIDGFPDTGMKGTLSKKLLRKQAKKLGYDDIAGRLAADPDYANKLARVPDNRISHLRTQVKKACASQVVSQYGLRPGDGGRVQRWLDRRFYIFPGDVDKRLEKNLPYEHPIFVEVIASCFFRGSESIALKWASRFKSSDPDRLYELEVPQAMVALVATAVHNALMEWRSGAYRALAFHGAVFEEQYRSHLEILEGIKARSLRIYHAMMHRLFTAASSSTDSTIRASENDPDATIDVIDFDAAPEA